jgi:acetolactate synthase-1/2/3 large subunit
MKLTDFIAQYVSKEGIDKVFAVQGGAALHLIDSIERNELIDVIAMQHEQSSAMAADAYAKFKGAGVTISTSGPGATNLITGIACSYFDSVPTVHITGNVASFRSSADIGVRQYGFQETDIVSIVKPITKYAIQLTKPCDILHILPKAFDIAKSDRQGPVLIDIPDDFQRVELDDDLVNLVLNKEEMKPSQVQLHEEKNNSVVSMAKAFHLAQRPIAVIGAGVMSTDLSLKAIEFCEKQQLPYLITWPMKGITGKQGLNMGGFGTHCLRGNNLAIQNADFIISLGCRLDSRATAKLDSFAREAQIVMIDIDNNEISKFEHFGKKIDFGLNMDLGDFFYTYQCQVGYKKFETKKWIDYILAMKKKYNQLPYYALSAINPYTAVQKISEYFKENQSIVIDTGTCLPLTLVYANEKKGQRYISSYNNTPMGYALPSAIGVASSKSSKECVICIAGDGGLQMNIQELATVNHLNIPMLIIVFNNFGHSMIKQTQDDWLNSDYYASSTSSGIPEINFSQVANAYGIESIRVNNNAALNECLSQVFDSASKKPYLLELVISDDFRCEPIIKYGEPLEYISPIIDRAEINQDMLIDTYNTKNT